MPYYIQSDDMTGREIVIHIEGNRMDSFMKDEGNSDYQAYLAWVAEGNTPEPWPPAE